MTIKQVIQRAVANRMMGMDADIGRLKENLFNPCFLHAICLLPSDLDESSQGKVYLEIRLAIADRLVLAGDQILDEVSKGKTFY